MARSNPAKDPIICIIMRPAGVVVSIPSVSDLNPAPAASIFSIMCSTSFNERDSRSSLPDDDGVPPQPVEHQLQLGTIPKATGSLLFVVAGARRERL